MKKIIFLIGVTFLLLLACITPFYGFWGKKYRKMEKWSDKK